jgi:hypothetical protein
MKKILITLIMVLAFASSAYSSQWCEWVNDTPTNCQREGTYGVKVDNVYRAIDETNLNNLGYYPRILRSSPSASTSISRG